MDTTINTERDKGFTLIELLIVIVILGILAAVTVFAVGGISDRGTVNACKAEYKSVEVAVEAFRAQSATGAYPANVDAVVGSQNGFLRSTPQYTWNLDSTTGAVTAGANVPTGCP